MSKRKIRMTGRNVATAIFLLLANFFIIIAFWKNVRFGTMDMTTILFQLKVPMGGADPKNFIEIFVLLFTIGPVMTAAEIGLFVLCGKWRCRRIGQGKKAQVLTFVLKYRRLISVILMIAAFAFLGSQARMFRYEANQLRQTKIYEDEDVDPRKAEIEAPEKKRNLIWIYLESMEITYTDTAHGGASEINLIPELTETALNGICFAASDSEKLNGAQSVVGTTWTMASLVAQTSGVPLTIPLGSSAIVKNRFMPGIYTLDEVLRDNGYERTMLLGSEKRFSGLDVFFETHGNETVKDLKYYTDNGILPEDYFVWWGFEDEKLYGYAKEEIASLAAGDKPFAFSMMTMDTHFTDGYVCRLCGDEYPDQYSNVLVCASKQLKGFLDWLKEQPFYDDTTVIITGDHILPDTKYADSITKRSGYDRRTYCVILNSAVTKDFPMARDFTAMDMYPTALTAMGFTIPGNRLGLGVNLFSGEKTLLEKYGVEKLDSMLEKRSDFYEELIYGPED